MQDTHDDARLAVSIERNPATPADAPAATHPWIAETLFQRHAEEIASASFWGPKSC